MAGWSSNGQKKMRVLAAMTVLILMGLTEFAAADNSVRQLGGRKFTINNVFTFDGTPPCPSTNPNTVAFYPSSYNSLSGTLTISGEFDAASIGVCTGSPYAVPPGTTIQYYIYGDWVIFKVPGRVSSAAMFVTQQGKLTSVGVGNNYYVSVLTDAGRAP